MASDPFGFEPSQPEPLDEEPPGPPPKKTPKSKSKSKGKEKTKSASKGGSSRTRAAKEKEKEEKEKEKELERERKEREREEKERANSLREKASRSGQAAAARAAELLQAKQAAAREREARAMEDDEEEVDEDEVKEVPAPPPPARTRAADRRSSLVVPATEPQGYSEEALPAVAAAAAAASAPPHDYANGNGSSSSSSRAGRGRSVPRQQQQETPAPQQRDSRARSREREGSGRGSGSRAAAAVASPAASAAVIAPPPPPPAAAPLVAPSSYQQPQQQQPRYRSRGREQEEEEEGEEEDQGRERRRGGGGVGSSRLMQQQPLRLVGKRGLEDGEDDRNGDSPRKRARTDRTGRGGGGADLDDLRLGRSALVGGGALGNPGRRQREAAAALRQILEHLIKKVVVLGGTFPIGRGSKGSSGGSRRDLNIEDCRNLHDLLKKYSIQELAPYVEAHLRLHPEIREEVEGLTLEEKLQLSLPGDSKNSLDLLNSLVRRFLLLGGVDALPVEKSLLAPFEGAQSIRDVLAQASLDALMPFLTFYVQVHPEVLAEANNLSFEERLLL